MRKILILFSLFIANFSFGQQISVQNNELKYRITSGAIKTAADKDLFQAKINALSSRIVSDSSRLNTEITRATNVETALSNRIIADSSSLITGLNTKLTKSSNLSDLTSASTARTNLGLGELATKSYSSDLALKNYVDATTLAHITTSKYLATNGITEVTLSGFNISEIDISEAEGVKIYGYFSNIICALVFKDSLNNIVGDIIVAPSSGYFTYEYLKPAGAVKAFTSYSTSSNRVYIHETYNIIGSEYTNVTSTAKVTVDKYLGSNGTTITSLSGFEIKEIDVSECDGVKVYGYFSSSLCALCFKDAENRILATPIVANTSGYATYEYLKPAGAVKAFTSYSTSSSRTFSQETFLINSIKNEIQKANVANEKIGELSTTNKETITSQLIPGGAWLSGGTYSTAGTTNWGHLDNLDATDIYEIEVFTRFVSTIGYVIWNILDGSKVIMVGPSTAVTERRIYKKPEGAFSVNISVIDVTSVGINEVVLVKKITNPSVVNSGISKENSLKNIKNVTIIPVFGQSLSIGAAATPAISGKEKYGIGRNTNFGSRSKEKALGDFKDIFLMRESDSDTNGETPLTGTVEAFVESIAKENGVSVNSTAWNDKLIIMSSCGEGGKKISELIDDTDGYSYYDGMIAFVQYVTNWATANGYTVDCPVWCMIQGESDQKYETTDYKTQLSALQTQLNTDIKAITGQESDITCVLYQTSSQSIVAPDGSTNYLPTFASPNMGVPTAQMELVRDSAAFAASTPIYPLEHSSAEPIHLTNISSKILGAYQGISLKKLLIDGIKNKGVVPLSFEVSGNSIIITYNVPVQPLQFDELLVKSVSNYGFTCIKSNDANIVTSVTIWDNKVTVNTSESPIGTKLRYGFNGTSFFAGKEKGSRGNLRDNQGAYNYIDIDGIRYPLHNWAYAFEKLL